MRSSKLTTAVAAAAAGLLALAPAGAMARTPKGGHLGVSGCHPSLVVEPHVVNSGDSVLLSGSALNCLPPLNASGETVSVYEKIAGVHGAAKFVGTATTLADGTFTFTPNPLITGSSFYAKIGRFRSPTRQVRVAPTVEFEGPKAAALVTGATNAVTFTGKVTPSDTGAEVVLQREAATSTEEWHTIQTGNFVKADGTFTIPHRFGIPGEANLRAVVRPHGVFDVRSPSAPLSYVINKPQNPNLTLESKSGNPLNYGQSLTLGGVVKGAGVEKVSLMRKTFGSSTFTKVAEGTTTSGGAYEFNVGAVEQNASYKVTNGMVTSHTLFIGVKWVVDTASVSATKVTSGQQIEFTGTVSPDRSGHFVYLEKHNQFIGGYHVVDLTTVEAVDATTGKFSIKFNPVGSGKQVYRIHIPGDPINQSGSSATFELEVTPSAIALKPLVHVRLPKSD
jgi:hypothetical protein